MILRTLCHHHCPCFEFNKSSIFFNSILSTFRYLRIRALYSSQSSNKCWNDCIKTGVKKNNFISVLKLLETSKTELVYIFMKNCFLFCYAKNIVLVSFLDCSKTLRLKSFIELTPFDFNFCEEILFNLGNK